MPHTTLRVAHPIVYLSILAVVVSCLGAPHGVSAQSDARKVIVLGFDGMDHELTSELIAQGQLPNLARLAETGTYQPLGTSIPPQSPVAWSNFITGMDSGGHGIFDFVHRDPKTLMPYLSTSKTEEGGRTLKFGQYQIPLSGGGTELMRRGEAFWEVLARNGIPSTIVRMPANYPPSETADQEISGMGTPDIRGTYGTFSFYTFDASAYDLGSVSGGEIYEVSALNHVVRAELEGPDNPFFVKRTQAKVPFSVYLDSREPVAVLDVQGQEQLLKEGEWSEWIPIHYDFVNIPWLQPVLRVLPGTNVPAMVRFYLKQVRPNFELYATPVNFDPMKPATPISNPGDYCAHLADATGRYYTQGMPEDTHALGEGVFGYDEFLAQARITGEEFITQYEQVLGEFDEGLLFYYFGNLDQICHMMWRAMDPQHPAYDAERDAPYAEAVRDVYRRMDEVVGYTLENMDAQTTLIVMSDHGFTSFRRGFHLNAWLRDEGYLTETNPGLRNDPGFLTNVNWRKTKAYGLGLNGLYINLEGREEHGIVSEADREALMDEISRKLLAAIDPETGEHAVTRMYKREEAFKDRGNLEIGPDLVVGYAKRTRCSNDSAKGAIPRDQYEDNEEAWSGDHCMDHEAVPGILFTSRPLKKAAPSLQDLAAAILAEFGLEWDRKGQSSEE